MSVSQAKARLGRVIDNVVKSGEPVVIARGQKHVIVSHYELPTPEYIELMRIRGELDRGGVSSGETPEFIEQVQAEIRKYRAEKNAQRVTSKK